MLSHLLVVAIALLAGGCIVEAVGPASLDADGVYRGINLGGWLVLESWLTPSLYADNKVQAGGGEWQFCQVVGRDQCGDVLQPHWDTWLNETHIEILSEAGFQYARIPIGYWILDRNATEPLPAGGWYYLERAIGWLGKHGMKAVIDLHGAPGSQNGHDNSGKSGPIEWNTPTNINRTVHVLGMLASRVVAWDSNKTMAGVVAGIETLNEPWSTAVNGPITFDTLRAFYVQAYDAIRTAGFNGIIWISDAFAGSQPWEGVLAPPDYTNVMLDSHLYHAFGGPTSNMTPWAVTDYVCSNDAPGVSARTDADWVVVGEWSNALKQGNTPTGPNALTPDAASWLRSMTAAQMRAWDGSYAGGPGRGNGPGKGSFFWNFRTETGISEWDMLLMLRSNAAPTSADTAQFSTFEFQC